MAQVTVRINGYAYTVGCQDGEEQHLMQMAEQVERRIDSIKAVAGQSGEARMLVMAALLMADDLFEMSKTLKEAQAASSAAAPATAAPPAPDAKLNRRISKLARRAEDIAAGLEGT
ncbi:MAG: cell division protein ZapA [Proteobacteria bacterium]|nr:cell division protein ZapA [Pseudomonadota bacterium]